MVVVVKLLTIVLLGVSTDDESPDSLRNIKGNQRRSGYTYGTFKTRKVYKLDEYINLSILFER